MNRNSPLAPALTAHLVDQDWAAYGPREHETWNTLYRRQMELLPGRVTPAFLDGVDRLDLSTGGIPDLRHTNRRLQDLTGWTVVCVAGKIPDDVFFELLANRHFPSGNFIRRPDELDYIEAPDIFHDLFGHVPMLTHPVFADFIQEYGKAGRRALEIDALDMLSRLFWFTVEFGLMKTAEGLRIYGSGIVSSFSETQFCLDSPSSNLIDFDLARVMRTDYFIDDFQPTYFVIDDYDDLYRATRSDLEGLYTSLRGRPLRAPGEIEVGDRIHRRGTQSHFLVHGKVSKLTLQGGDARRAAM